MPVELNIPTKLRMENVACGVCKSDNSSAWTSGQDYEYGTSSDVFTMVACNDCGNVYLNPRPIEEELGTIYPPNYYAYNYESAINPIALKGKDILDGLKVKQWFKYARTKQPTFLDVGCGNGRYLEMMHKLGVPKDKLFGIEMSEPAIARLTEAGYHGVFGRVETATAQLPNHSFDLIVMLQVLEHVADPQAAVATLSELLAPGGVLIIETPNTESIDAQVFKEKYWGGYHFPRHWNLFNVRALTRLANDSGLSVKSVRYLPAHSFWIFSLHHILAYKCNQNKAAAFFNPLQNIGLLAFFTGLDIVRAKCGAATSNVQVILQKPRS